MTVLTIIKPSVYNITILISREEHQFNDTYKVYLTDESYGRLYIVYEKNIEAYMVNAEFKKAGKTEVVLESPNGEKTLYNITIKRDTYTINKGL